MRLIQDLCWNQKAAVKVGDKLREWREFRREVRQGCALSPNLFKLYSKMIMRTIEDLKGIRIKGENITNDRDADDTALIADSESKLQVLVDCLVREREQYERAKSLNV